MSKTPKHTLVLLCNALTKHSEII